MKPDTVVALFFYAFVFGMITAAFMIHLIAGIITSSIISLVFACGIHAITKKVGK